MKASEITPGNIGELRRLERMKGLGDREVVSAWYRAEDADTWNLTPRQEEIRRRVDFAKAQFLARLGYEDTMNALASEFSIGIATARRDIAQAMNLFGNIDKVPKEAHRARAIEMALATFKVAEQEADAGGMAKATLAYISATGLDKDDTDAVDMEKLMKERTYVEVLDPALRDLLLNFLAQSGGSVDVTRLFEKIYEAKQGEYTDYENADNS